MKSETKILVILTAIFFGALWAAINAGPSPLAKSLTKSLQAYSDFWKIKNNESDSEGDGN